MTYQEALIVATPPVIVELLAAQQLSRSTLKIASRGNSTLKTELQLSHHGEVK